MTALIKNLEAMLAAGRDDALLRFSLGTALLGEKQVQQAIGHLERAVTIQPGYSAAWKMLGRAYAMKGDDDQAARAYRSGIAIADQRGDKQAAREMRVFLRRIEKKAR